MDESILIDGSKLEPLICTRCNHINSATAKFCNKCGLVLDLKTVIGADNIRSKIDTLIDKLAKDPHRLEKILQIVLDK